MNKRLEVGILMDYYGKLLTKTQLSLADLYYNEDLSLSEIAENTGITRQGVYDSVHRTEILLREYEQKLHLKKKKEEEIKYFEQISNCCEELKKLGNSQASNLADDILNLTKKFKDKEGSPDGI